jgi:serine protease AprX
VTTRPSTHRRPSTRLRPAASSRGRAAGALAALATLALGTAALAPASSAQAALPPVQGLLADQLDGLGALTPTYVMVHGRTIADANAAVAAAGMDAVTTYDRIGVAVARGTRSQVEVARSQPGVTYLEGNTPIEFSLSTSHRATRGAEAMQTLTGADGTALRGTGVSVAVIDSGIDPTHPFFREPDGSSAVVANLKSLCLDESTTGTDCVVRVPRSLDTDTISVGGHGTHVSGIVAGRPTRLSDGSTVMGAAPGAKLVSISTGAALFVIGADSALNWVLENHEAPCGAGVPASTCPPIKVTNNSYGPSGGGAFDPSSATVKLQRALAAEGVTTVWAAGNDGGDGTTSLTNPAGQDPTGGVISVASYHDLGTGARDGAVSEYSSRGLAGDPSTWPDLSAPGQDIVSSCRPYLVICSTGLAPVNGPGLLDLGTFNTISGTSMAAPHVAGIVAQLVQADPAATPAEIEQALKGTAHRFTDGAPYAANGSSYDKGTGLVDVVAATTALQG